MSDFLAPAVRRVKSRLFTPTIIRDVRSEGLTYLTEAALIDLHRRVGEIERERMPGALIEAGCALGGSAIVIATAKSPGRPFYVHDVFGMIPPPSDEDGTDVHQRYETILSGQSRGIKGGKYYGYEDDLVGKVTENFARHGVTLAERNVHLMQGLFEETLVGNEPVALAHIDGDWYNSVKVCLEQIAPRLVEGGVLVIDDYDAWSGCRKAVDEWFADKGDRFALVRRERLHIERRH
jgi:hypothetical protein